MAARSKVFVRKTRNSSTLDIRRRSLILHSHDCKMRSIIPLLSFSALLAPVQSLYFYIDGTTPKCFFEELPKDTLVVGHYTAEEFNDQRKVWEKHDGLNIFISVDVRFGYSANPPFQRAIHSDNFTGSIRQ